MSKLKVYGFQVNNRGTKRIVEVRARNERRAMARLVPHLVRLGLVELLGEAIIVSGGKKHELR